MVKLNIKRKIQLAVVLLFLPLIAYASVNGPVFSHTGAPGDQGNCTECHAGNVNAGPGSVSITGIPIAYSPGQTYPLIVTVQQNGRQRFGFQLTSIDAGNNRAGTLVSLTGETQILDITGQGGRQYIEHTQQGTTGSN